MCSKLFIVWTISISVIIIHKLLVKQPFIAIKDMMKHDQILPWYQYKFFIRPFFCTLAPHNHNIYKRTMFYVLRNPNPCLIRINLLMAVLPQHDIFSYTFSYFFFVVFVGLNIKIEFIILYLYTPRLKHIFHILFVLYTSICCWLITFY